MGSRRGDDAEKHFADAIVKERPRFDQVIRPKPGAVVASPVLAAYDPEPDYFFHWYRDSALW